MATSTSQTVIVDSYKISCDGGDTASGHPRVYLQMPNEHGWVECPYCDCKFVHSDHAESAGSAN